MKWYEAIAEMVKDPTKEFTANGWTWKMIGDTLHAKKDDSSVGYLDYANIDAVDQKANWTLVIPPPKEYTFKEMVKELLKLGRKYYGQCTDTQIGLDKMFVTGYPNAASSFIMTDSYGNKIFTDYILDDTLRFHIKPKE